MYSITFRWTIGVAALGCCLSVGSPVDARKWMDVTGTHSIEAEFVGLVGTEVQLKTPDGRIVKVPLLKLSNADRRFVAKIKTDRKQKGIAIGKVSAHAAVNRQVRIALAKKIKFERPQLTLTEAVAKIQREAELAVFIDEAALEEMGLRTDEMVAVSTEPTSVDIQLDAITGEDLDWLMYGNVVVVTDRHDGDWYWRPRVYVATGPLNAEQLVQKLTTEVAPEEWIDLGGSAMYGTLGQRVFVLRHRWRVYRDIEKRYAKLLKPVESAKPVRRPTVVEQRLATVGKLQFGTQPLSQLVKNLSDQHKLRLVVDQKSLAEIGIAPDKEVTLSISSTTLQTGLDLVLHQHDLIWSQHGGNENTLVITTDDGAEYFSRDYDVRALMSVRVDLREELCAAMTAVVSDDSWESMGGEATVAPVPNTTKIRVHQTAAAHWTILNLLADFEAAK